jgi:hypothetical protein
MLSVAAVQENVSWVSVSSATAHPAGVVGADTSATGAAVDTDTEEDAWEKFPAASPAATEYEYWVSGVNPVSLKEVVATD